MLEIEVIETLPYRCVTWSPNKPDYDRPRQIPYFMHLEYLGWRKQEGDNHTLSYVNTSAKMDTGSMEVTVGNQTLFAGFVANMWEKLPRKVTFVEVIDIKVTQNQATKRLGAHFLPCISDAYYVRHFSYNV